MPIAFDRSVCCDLNETISREWLITNGRGGYAAGTVAGVLTRLEHGLLVASLQEVATPQLLLAKIDEEIVFDQRTYYLGTNEYPEAAQRVLNLTLLPFSAYRPHSQPQYGNNEWHFQVQAHNRKQDTPEEHFTFPEGVAGCTIRARDGASAYSIFAMGHPDSQTTFIPTGVWYWHFLHRHDQVAGRPAVDDLYLPGVIRTKLWPDEGSTLTLILTAEDASSYTLRPNQVNLSYKRSVEKQRNVLQPQRYF